MSNYSIEELVSICYDPGIPTDLDFGNMSVPEITQYNHFVDSLEFSTFTMDFPVEQLMKKRNGDTFIEELNIIGSPIPPEGHAGLAKLNIKFYYTPLTKQIGWKYDKSGGIFIDYTGIRYKVTEYLTNGTSSEKKPRVLDPMAHSEENGDTWYSPVQLAAYCKSALYYMDNHPDDPVVYSGRENYENLLNSAMGSFYTASFYVYRTSLIYPS